MECSIIFNEMVLVFINDGCVVVWLYICRQLVGGRMVPSWSGGGCRECRFKVAGNRRRKLCTYLCVLISRVTRNYYFKISYRPDFGDFLSALCVFFFNNPIVCVAQYVVGRKRYGFVCKYHGKLY